jgi:hypothetical protein
MMTIQIVEIIGRSIQGVTNPFICKCEDGQTYFVKGNGAGKQSLIAEYVGGCLARAFGLPVADFEIVEIPSELIKWCGRDDAHELGVELAFGSRALPHVQEFSISHIPQVDVQTRKDVALFDWWVHNADRTLSEKGGNPNLLWDQEHSKLAVIDHNQAFDIDFDAQLFAQSHVFHANLLDIFDDLVDRQNYLDRLAAAFAEFDLACDNVPDEWWSVDNGVPTSFNRNAARAMLSRYMTNDFWRIA